MERCRFCFIETNRELFKDIFNNEQVNPSIPQIVEMLTNLTITITDPYTKLSCLDCFHKLIDFYHYRETIVETNQLFIENEININNKNNNQNYGQLIYLHDNFNGVTEDSLHLDNESDGKRQWIYENNQHLNKSIDNDKVIDDYKNCNNENDDGEKDNQESFVFVKDEVDIEETRVKIENDFIDGDQKNCENYHHPNLSFGRSNNDTITNSDNQINDNNGSDKYCSDTKQDGSSIKEFPSIIDTDEKPYQCLICNKKFKMKHSLKRHLLTHDGEKPYQCNICEKRFSGKYYLTAHLNIHTDEKTYHCHICNKKFILKSNLKKHLFSHTGEKPYQCNICKNKFSNKYNLSTHLKSHKGENSYQCTICKKKFSTKSYLSAHLNMHTDQKNYQCHMCDKKFMVKYSLKQHLLRHTGEISYQCNVCEKKLTTKSNLYTHLNIHTEEKTYQCNICHKKFNVKSSLKQHLVIHTGEKPYQCNICNKKFSFNSCLSAHLKTHKGDQSLERNDNSDQNVVVIEQDDNEK